MGQRRLYEDGAEFCLSDHCGLMAFVDVHDVYKSGQGAVGAVARARREQLVALRDVAVQRELVEAKNLEVGEVLQAGSVQVCQLVEGDVQGSKGGRERCQELMDSCEERILWMYIYIYIWIYMDIWKVYSRLK